MEETLQKNLIFEWPVTLKFKFCKEAVCSCISTFVSSFYVIPVECGCQIYQKYIPLYEHYNDKKTKILYKWAVQCILCTHSIYLYIMPILANLRQNRFFVILVFLTFSFFRLFICFWERGGGETNNIVIPMEQGYILVPWLYLNVYTRWNDWFVQMDHQLSSKLRKVWNEVNLK